MDLLKTFILLFSACSHVYPSTTSQTPTPWQNNTRKMNSLSNDHKNCFCYPDGELPTVQQLLDLQNNGQERLVIYLYKNDATNEIKMYTPNANKQALIPDIPFESGDGLITVTTENVISLLYNNPNKIKVYNDHIQTIIPTVTDSFPIGLNTGAIEHIYPKGDSYLNPNGNYKANEYSLAQNIIMANGPSGAIVNDLQKGSTNIPSNVFPEQYDNKKRPEQYWIANNYPYTKPNDPLAIPLNLQTAPDNSQSIPLNPQYGPGNPQTFLEETVVSVDSEYPYKLEAIPLNSQSILPNPQAFPENLQVHPGNSQGISAGPSKPQFFQDSYVGGLDPNIVFTFQSDKPGSQDLNHPLPAKHMTFSVWFSQQMKRFQNIHLPNDIKTIDSGILRILVQKTFYENNIYVSADGVITDSKGKVIDTANLELRPLLLGETLNHQILQNVHEVIKLPKHLPYLEGILVTLLSPPQILGIIPLGKTYLPQTAYMNPVYNGSKIYINDIPNTATYSTNSQRPNTFAYKEIYPGPTNYYAYSSLNGLAIPENSISDTNSKILPLAYPNSDGNQNLQPGLNERAYWTSGPYQTISQLPYPTANWNPSELLQLLGQRRKMSDVKIEHHYEPPVKTRKKGKGRKLNDEKGNISGEITNMEPFPSLNGTKSGRRFPAPSLTGIMKTLLYLLNDLPSRRGLNSTEIVDIEKESESNKDGGAPDFRIIGGNAATGSGTPLSNKGRSGYTEVI